jgi:hypothetical protein
VRESVLEERLRVAVRRLGGVCWKLPSKFYRGIPDRMILLPLGRVYFIELKASNGRPSAFQLSRIAFLRKIGFDARILIGPDELQAFIDALSDL